MAVDFRLELRIAELAAMTATFVRDEVIPIEERTRDRSRRRRPEGTAAGGPAGRRLRTACGSYEEFRSVAGEFVKRSVTPYADKFITSCGGSNPPHRSFTATFDTADRVVHHIRPTFSGHERPTHERVS